MRTHVPAAVLLLAGCLAPRVERARSDPEPDSPERAAVQPARCTRENPCTLEVVEVARRRAALEADTEGKMADANVNAQTKRVADRWMQTLAKSIAEERDRFSEWCDTAQGWSADKRKSGAAGLTSEDVFPRTGQPTRETTPESRAEGAENRAWAWDVDGPLSRTVSFAILFMRPAGTGGPWIFAGCQWCASGGPATSPGCVPLPVKR
jgi:hypothetical protein